MPDGRCEAAAAIGGGAGAAEDWRSAAGPPQAGGQTAAPAGGSACTFPHVGEPRWSSPGVERRRGLQPLETHYAEGVGRPHAQQQAESAEADAAPQNRQRQGGVHRSLLRTGHGDRLSERSGRAPRAGCSVRYGGSMPRLPAGVPMTLPSPSVGAPSGSCSLRSCGQCWCTRWHTSASGTRASERFGLSGPLPRQAVCSSQGPWPWIRDSSSGSSFQAWGWPCRPQDFLPPSEQAVLARTMADRRQLEVDADAAARDDSPMHTVALFSRFREERLGGPVAAWRQATTFALVFDFSDHPTPDARIKFALKSCAGRTSAEACPICFGPSDGRCRCQRHDPARCTGCDGNLLPHHRFCAKCGTAAAETICRFLRSER